MKLSIERDQLLARDVAVAQPPVRERVQAADDHLRELLGLPARHARARLGRLHLHHVRHRRHGAAAQRLLLLARSRDRSRRGRTCGTRAGCSCTNWKPAAAAFSIRRAPSMPGAEAAATRTPEHLHRGAVHQLAVELLLAREVLVDERLRDARRGRDVVDADVLVAALAEDLVGGLEDALAPLLGAQPPARPLRSLDFCSSTQSLTQSAGRASAPNAQLTA